MPFVSNYMMGYAQTAASIQQPTRAELWDGEQELRQELGQELSGALINCNCGPCQELRAARAKLLAEEEAKHYREPSGYALWLRKIEKEAGDAREPAANSLTEKE